MFSQMEMPSTWKTASDLESAKMMIDRGVVLSWTDAKRVAKAVKQEELDLILVHVAERLAERVNSRLPEEILVETAVLLMVNGAHERLMQAFLEALLVQPERTEACFRIVEVALTAEPSETEHDDVVFAMAVSLICELGLAVRELDRRYPGEIVRASEINEHISTYLQSVSNTNNNAIRLSLLNYFGATEADNGRRDGFNKIMGRFGHTILEHLFFLLFKKKSEAVALQYLLENTPYLMEGDRHTQRIVHETWKFYMLKMPDRFGLFIQTFSKHIIENNDPKFAVARRVFCQHLGALLQVISDVNHRELAREVICALTNFRHDPNCRSVISDLRNLNTRNHIRDLVTQLLDDNVDSNKVIESASRFVQSKRGRKPSFQRVEGWMTVNQVHYLGQIPTAKAS